MLAPACSATGDHDNNTPTVQRPRPQPPRAVPRKEDDKGEGGSRRRRHGHTLAILTLPHSASARIVNGAILETAMSVTSDKLSVVIRASAADDDDDDDHDGVAASLTQLRRYVGEVYSVAWDAAFGIHEGKRRGKEGDDDDDNEPSFAKYSDDRDDGENSKIATSEGWKLLDLIVYPENVPNVATEDEIVLRPDLSCVCGRDSIASRRGGGGGSLRERVDAVNAERASGGLSGTLEALHVDVWPDGADATCDPNVIFLEDDDAFEGISMEELTSSSSTFERRRRRRDYNNDACDGSIGPDGGEAICRRAPPLYSSVCVGGTFDMMHYGHRKLLTLAVSSVRPGTGRLHVGVKSDDMLTRKAYARSIQPYDERLSGVLDFVSNLAPAMGGRVRCVPLGDEYGPPGQPVDPSRACPGLPNDYDALVISHESLPAGRRLNIHREEVLGLRPLKLLCTQRTDPHGMSSTALRRMRMERRM